MCDISVKMSKDKQFAKELVGELNKGTSKKSLGQAVGLPDKEDEEFLRKLVAEYEEENPGWLAYMRDTARKMFEAGVHGAIGNETGKLGKTGMTYDFELPVSFFKKIERHYPLMFSDVNHYRWFKKTFSALMIRPNIKRNKR